MNSEFEDHTILGWETNGNFYSYQTVREYDRWLRWQQYCYPEYKVASTDFLRKLIQDFLSDSWVEALLVREKPTVLKQLNLFE